MTIYRCWRRRLPGDPPRPRRTARSDHSEPQASPALLVVWAVASVVPLVAAPLAAARVCRDRAGSSIVPLLSTGATGSGAARAHAVIVDRISVNERHRQSSWGQHENGSRNGMVGGANTACIASAHRICGFLVGPTEDRFRRQWLGQGATCVLHPARRSRTSELPHAAWTPPWKAHSRFVARRSEFLRSFKRHVPIRRS